jgi:hypothetical protein
MKLGAAICAATLVLVAAPGRAEDPWETDSTDDSQASRSHILPGQVQTGRDLEGGGSVAIDQDWVKIYSLSRHSYEARVSGGPLWSQGGFVGAQLDLLDSTPALLLAGNGDEFANLRGQAVRWIVGSPTPTQWLLRITGPPGVQAAVPYTLELFDTTYSVPRWNNSASQITFFFVQNNKPLPVSGAVYFFNASGSFVHDHQFVLAANGLLVLNTSTIPQLVGLSGSALVAQGGGRGAISGKAVALEPGTGFTFDTTMMPVQP